MGDITAKVDIALNESGGRTVKRSLDDIADSAQRGVQPVNNLNSSLGSGARAADIFFGSLKALGGILATIKLTSLITEAATLSQRYSELGIAMTQVGVNAGISKSKLDETAVSLQKLGISMIESRQVVTKLVTANIDLANATKLADLARNTAIVGQINTSQALDKLVHGIQSAQVEELRGIGINVSFENSYKQLKDQLGITGRELTENEKMTARLNATLGEASKFAGLYDAAMENAGKQMRSTERLVENLKIKIGGLFDQASIVAVTTYSDLIKDLDAAVSDLAESGELKDWSHRIAIEFAGLMDLTRVFIGQFGILGNLLSTQFTNIKSGNFGEMSAAFSNADIALKALYADGEKYQDQVNQRIILEDLLTKKVTGGNNNIKDKKLTNTGTPDSDETKKQINDYLQLINSIKEKISLNNADIAATKSITEAEKIRIDIETKLSSGILKLNSQRKASIDAALEELKISERLLENKKFVKQQSEALVGIGNSQTNALRQQLDDIRAQNALIGLNKEQVIALAGAKNLETAAVIRNAAAYAGDMHDAYIQYANDLETAGGLQKQLVQERQVQDYVQAWRSGWSTIEQTGRNAFVQFSAHGISAAESIGQAIKTSIIDMLYQLTVRKWIINIGTSLEGAFINNAIASAAGGSGLGFGNVLSMGSNALSAINKGFGSLLGRGASALGFSSFGAGASGAASAGVFGAGGLNYLGGAGTALGAGSEFGAMASMGASFAAAAGPIMGLLVADQLTKMFAGDKLISNSGIWKTLSSVPILGVLPNIINGLFGHGPMKFRQQSLQGDVSSSGFDGDITNVFRAKGGLFVGNKHKSVTEQLSQDQQDLFDQTIKGFYTSAHGFAENLGFSTDLVDTFTKTIQIKSEKGKKLTEEAITEMIQGIGDSLAKNVIPGIDDFRKAGEKSFDTFTRLNTEFITLSDAATILGKSAAESRAFISGASLEGRTGFVDAAGGIDKLNQKVSVFAQNFLTQSERLAPAQEKLNDELKRLGLSTNLTKDQFKDLVQSFGKVNGVTEETLQSLLTISGDFAASRAAMLSDANSSFNVLQKSVEAERKKITDKFNSDLSTVNSRIQDVNDSISKLNSLSATLKSTTDTINPQSLSNARDQIRAAISSVAAGEIPDSEALKQSLDTLSRQDSSSFATLAEFQRSQAQSVDLIDQLKTATGSQLTLEERSLAALEANRDRLQAGFDNEVARLDSILTQGQLQLDAMNGINTSVLSLADAMRGFNVSSIGAGGSAIGQSASGVSYQDINAFSAVHTPDEIYAAAKQYGVSQADIVASGAFTDSQVNDYLMAKGLASFDVGGRVPKTGLAMIHKDEQVLTSGQQDAITSEIKQMREELSAALALIAGNTGSTAEILDQVSGGGNAFLTEAA